jgi:hypothetical protein
MVLESWELGCIDINVRIIVIALAFEVGLFSRFGRLGLYSSLFIGDILIRKLVSECMNVLV